MVSTPSDVGIGVPSKYLLLPLASLGSTETVTLNRASRVRPQRTKNVRQSVSRTDRKPMVNATMAGATPNEIYSSPVASVAVGMTSSFPKPNSRGVRWGGVSIPDRQENRAPVP